MDPTSTVPIDTPEALVARVQELQERLDAVGDAYVRELAEELVSAVVQMYGDGLARIVDTLLGDNGEEGERIARTLPDDPLVAMLLLIHDLHPVPLAQRVQEALEKVRPYMESHGGNVELLSLEDGIARIHLRGSCSDCSASSVTLELAIKQALEEAAPDLEGLEVEGVAPQMPGLGLPMAGPEEPFGFELPVVYEREYMSGGSAPPATPSWIELPDGAAPAAGAMAALDVAGARLLVANVDGTLLAYHDVCADCGAGLHGGTLADGALRCGDCGRSYFLPGAGRSMDDDHLQLQPVPLLSERGAVKVALAV